jgi:hypothetical protein
LEGFPLGLREGCLVGLMDGFPVGYVVGNVVGFATQDMSILVKSALGCLETCSAIPVSPINISVQYEFVKPMAYLSTGCEQS